MYFGDTGKSGLDKMSQVFGVELEGEEAWVFVRDMWYCAFCERKKANEIIEGAINEAIKMYFAKLSLGIASSSDGKIKEGE